MTDTLHQKYFPRLKVLVDPEPSLGRNCHLVLGGSRPVPGPSPTEGVSGVLTDVDHPRRKPDGAPGEQVSVST